MLEQLSLAMADVSKEESAADLFADIELEHQHLHTPAEKHYVHTGQ
jgi:hypothetical protein